MKKKIILIMILLFFKIESKIRILTFHSNRPDFLEIQYEKFKKFFNDEYEVLVFNDARNEAIFKEIEQKCKKLNLNHIKVPQEIHKDSLLIKKILTWNKNYPLLTLNTFKPLSHLRNPNGNHPSIRHCNVIKYALDNYGYNHNDIVVICEGDIFPIRQLNIRKFCKDFHIVGSIRGKCEYNDRKIKIDYKLHFIGPAIVFIDMRSLPNKFSLSFDLTYINNYITDTGGETYYFMKNNKVNIKKFVVPASHRLSLLSVDQLRKMKFNKNEINLIQSMQKFTKYDDCCEFHLDNHFLHFFHSSLRKNIEKEKIILSFLRKV